MGTIGSMEGSSLAGRSGTAMVDTPPGMTCVVITQGGLRLVAMADAADAGAYDGGELELDRIADLLEQAASTLRGEAPYPRLARASQGTSTRRVAPAVERLHVGQLEIHPESRLVLRGGQPIPLSRIEFDLFLALVRRRGAPATRLELVREVWGYGAAVTSRSVDTQIYNLRHKLEENPATPRYLLTVSGVGYRVMP